MLLAMGSAHIIETHHPGTRITIINKLKEKLSKQTIHKMIFLA
jgi:hypothetical protein